MSFKVVPEINMKDIATIATLLRDEGDQILNCSCKLSLTVDFLVNLNEAFDLIVDNVESSCFQVINTNNSSVEIFHDLQFLHDFIQKVIGLRLWNRSTCVYMVNLEKFRALRTLELYAVNISNIDFTSTRDRLSSITCTRSNLRDLKILFEVEAGESSEFKDGVDSVEVWTSLEELFLPFNDLISIGSLRGAPNLRFLDLSHNNLADLSALENSAENLEWLNVSYNRLKSFPSLACCTKLKILFVSDNRLEDLKGLAILCSLVNLDASRNLICEHSNLSDLMYLPNLENISLEGNPITFKRGHRLLTIAFVNPLALASHSVFLDKIVVSHMEKSHFPQKRPFNPRHHGVMIENQPGCSLTPKLHPASLSKYAADKRIDLSSSTRAVKIREAPIAEGECSTVIKPSENVVERSERRELAVHLETKRDVEKLRRMYGEENWLQGGGGLRILDILGIKVEAPDESVTQAEVHEEDSDKEGEEDKEEVVEAKENFVGENGAELGVFVAQRKIYEKDQVMDDILLILTDKYLVERNGTSGKVATRWHLSELQEVSKDKVTPNGTWVLLTFKSRFETSEKPVYFMDSDEAKELQRILLEILEKNESKAKVLLTCIRCSAIFPKSESIGGSSKEEECVPSCPKCGSTVVVQAFQSNYDQVSPATEVLSPISKQRTDSRITSLEVPHVNTFANWGELSTSEKTNLEATCHGLQLYVMLNILPDGDGKENEFQMHEALVHIVASKESFHGYIVLSKDSIYILKDSEKEDTRDSLIENDNPVLADWYPLTKCEAITCSYFGLTLQFESQLLIWIFPQNTMELQNDLAHLCPSLIHTDELHTSSSEVLMKLPLVSFHLEDHSSINGPILRLGMLVLTSTSISIINFQDLLIYKSDVSQDTSFTQIISDLVGMRAAGKPFMHQPGVALHFSGETDDRQLVVWPWGKGKLLEFIEALRKPWESLFSIPMETIAAQ